MSRLQLCNWTSLDFVNSTWHSFFGKPINHLNIIDGASNAHFFCPWIDSQATVLTRSHCIFPLKYAMFVHVYIIHFWDVMNGLTTSLMRWNPLFWWWNNHIWLSIHPKFHFFGFSPSKTLDFTIKKPRRYPKFSPLSPSQIPFQDISGWLRHCRPRLVPRFAAPHKTPRRRAAHAAQRSAAHLLFGAVVAGRLARGCGGVGGRSHVSAPEGKMIKWWGKLLENDGENVVFFFISWGFSTMQKGWLRWVLCLRWVKSHQPGMETAGVETEIYLVQNANKIQKPRWSWLEREIDHIFRSGYYFSASFGGRYAW